MDWFRRRTVPAEQTLDPQLATKIQNFANALAKNLKGVNDPELMARLNRGKMALGNAAARAVVAGAAAAGPNGTAARRAKAAAAAKDLESKLAQYLATANAGLFMMSFEQLAGNMRRLNSINNSNLLNNKNSLTLGQLKLKYRIMNSIKNSNKSNAEILQQAKALVAAVDTLTTKVRGTSNLTAVRTNINAFKAAAPKISINVNTWAKNQQAITNKRTRRRMAPPA